MNITGITPTHIVCFVVSLFVGIGLLIGLVLLRRWPKAVDTPYKITVAQDKGTP